MIEIKNYDELKAHVLELRTESARQATVYESPAARSFANGEVHACDRIFVAMMAWERSWKAEREAKARNRREGV